MPIPVPEGRLNSPVVEVSAGAGLALRPPEWAPWAAVDLLYNPEPEARAGLYPKVEVVGGAGTWLVGVLTVGAPATPTWDRPSFSTEIRVGIPGDRAYDAGLLLAGGSQAPRFHLGEPLYWAIAGGAWGRVEFDKGWALRAAWAPVTYGVTADSEEDRSKCSARDSDVVEYCEPVEVGPNWYTPLGPVDLAVFHEFHTATVGLRYFSPGFPADLPMTGFAVLAGTADVRWHAFVLRMTEGGSSTSAGEPLFYGELMIGANVLRER